MCSLFSVFTLLINLGKNVNYCENISFSLLYLTLVTSCIIGPPFVLDNLFDWHGRFLTGFFITLILLKTWHLSLIRQWFQGNIDNKGHSYIWKIIQKKLKLISY